VVPADHYYRGYVISLNDLALVYLDMGDLARAEALLQSSAEAMKQPTGEQRRDHAIALLNLAEAHRARGNPAKAEPLAAEASTTLRQAVGQDHPYYAASLQLLALLHQDQRDFAQAEKGYGQALKILKKSLGEKHTEYARGLTNLAGLYHDTREYAKAEEHHRQALEIYGQLVGERHPHYARWLSHQAALYRNMGDRAKAVELLAQALSLFSTFLSENFAGLSERQRIHLIHSVRGPLQIYLSMACSGEAAPSDVYKHVLIWKGAVAGRQVEVQAAHDQPELKPLLEQLGQARSRLCRRWFTVPAPEQRDTWSREVGRLREEKERLEGQLTERCEALRRQKRLDQLGPAELARLLPEGTALVDFLEYGHLAPPTAERSWSEGELRYAAFVVCPDRDLVCVPLGKAERITRAVRSWREALEQADRREAALAQEVAELVWKPLEAALAGTKAVLVAPDGALCLAPLAALPGPRPGSYLIEDLAIGYVTSGRHAVEVLSENQPVKGSGMLAAGGIDYDARVEPTRRAPGTGSRQVLREEQDRSGYGRLPHSEQEARNALQLFAKAFAGERTALLTGAGAHEARLKQELAARWRHVHLATHGFFAPPTVVSAVRTGAAPSKSLQLMTPGRAEENVIGMDPLLLCGLVLAGVNQPRTQLEDAEDQEDGILTAEEVTALDLRGTELVVLSACDTGLGVVARGEGVLGLQRGFAFQAGGARTLVTALWQADDKATNNLMASFYRNLWEKRLGPLASLREAQLAMIKHGAYDSSHPKFWAAWVLSGAPGDLSRLPAPSASAPSAAVADGQPPVSPEEPGPTVSFRSVVIAAGGLLALALAAYRFRRHRVP
jgi:CHAT domain-containing protein